MQMSKRHRPFQIFGRDPRILRQDPLPKVSKPLVPSRGICRQDAPRNGRVLVAAPSREIFAGEAVGGDARTVHGSSAVLLRGRERAFGRRKVVQILLQAGADRLKEPKSARRHQKRD